MTTPPVDLARLARAVHLTAEKLSGTRWRVSGGSQVHEIAGGTCDCPDYAMRGNQCKHLIAIRLTSLDTDLLEALRLMIAPPTHAGGRVGPALPRGIPGNTGNPKVEKARGALRSNMQDGRR